MRSAAKKTSPRYAAARRRLYSAAMGLFRKKGFEATTADEIATAAGLSRATFFNHFGSKSAVLRFFGEELEEEVTSLLAARRADTPPLDELRRLLLSMSAAAEAQRENLKIVLVHSIEDGTYFSQPTPARVRILHEIEQLLAEAQKRGEARTDLTALALANQIVALYNHGVVAILFSGQRAEDAVARLWEFALGGLTGTAAPASRTATKRQLGP